MCSPENLLSSSFPTERRETEGDVSPRTYPFMTVKYRRRADEADLHGTVALERRRLAFMNVNTVYLAQSTNLRPKDITSCNCRCREIFI